MRQPPPKDKDVTMDMIMATLPDVSQSCVQMAITWHLGRAQPDAVSAQHVQCNGTGELKGCVQGLHPFQVRFLRFSSVLRWRQPWKDTPTSSVPVTNATVWGLRRSYWLLHHRLLMYWLFLLLTWIWPIASRWWHFSPAHFEGCRPRIGTRP